MGKKICIGDLNNKVDLTKREIDYSSDAVSAQADFTLVASIWAKIVPISAYSKINETNTEKKITHKFIIRTRDDIFDDMWFLYKSNRYDIIGIESANDSDYIGSNNANDDYLNVYVNLTGDANNESSGR